MFAVFDEVTRSADAGSRRKITDVRDLYVRRESIDTVEFEGFCFTDDFEDFDTERVLMHTGLNSSWHRPLHVTRLRFDMWALFTVTISSGRGFEVIANYRVAPEDDYEWSGENLYTRAMVSSLCKTHKDTGNAAFHFPGIFEDDSESSWFEPNHEHSPRWRPRDYFIYRSWHFDRDVDALYQRWIEDGSPDEWNKCRTEDDYDYRGIE